MQNGYIKSFNGRMRDELLNESLFIDLDQARRLIGLGRRLQHSEAAFLARLQNAGRLCWYTDRAEGRNIGRGSNCRWMKVQWQVSENRMGSSRLQQAADILGVTVPFFFEGATAVRHSLEHCRLLNCATSASISTFILLIAEYDESSVHGLQQLTASAELPYRSLLSRYSKPSATQGCGLEDRASGGEPPGARKESPGVVAQKPPCTGFYVRRLFRPLFSIILDAAQPQSPGDKKMGERDCRGEGLPPTQRPGREPLLLRRDSNASKEAEFWDHVANQNSLG